ncbi:MAG: hypothetical protein KAS72_10530 [Phycisphaerales bacterium]|nr:hypothetical protein [Phycisphaerales bacterium]
MNSFADHATKTIQDQLLDLPAETRDPFRSIEQRIDSTVELYRYDTSPHRLLDWAAAQSGLADPLSACNRQELEAFFAQWARKRDAHLAALLGQLRRSDVRKANETLTSLPAEIQDAVRRTHVRR